MVELALSSYLGLYALGPPQPGSASGVYWPALLDQSILEHTVHHHDGSTEIIVPGAPHPTPNLRWRCPPNRPARRRRRRRRQATSWSPSRSVSTVHARSGDKGGDAEPRCLGTRPCRPGRLRRPHLVSSLRRRRRKGRSVGDLAERAPQTWAPSASFSGSREGLIRGIIETRMAPIDDARRELLAKATDANRSPSTEDLVSALVEPLADATVRHRHSCYGRFLARSYTEPVWAKAVEEDRPRGRLSTLARAPRRTPGSDPRFAPASKDRSRRDHSDPRDSRYQRNEGSSVRPATLTYNEA